MQKPEHKPIIGRYAPSPSGRLHLGNILTCLLTWLDVRSQNGILLFRLEDLDPERSYEDCAETMADDLRWLGLDWDAGWRPHGGEAFRQSRRTERYQAALDALGGKGLLYDCYCSRKERLAASAPHRSDGGAPRCRCHSFTPEQVLQMQRMGRKPAKKAAVDVCPCLWTDGHYGLQRNRLTPEDDFIVRRSDGVFAYQLAVSVDDMEMGVTRVVRASDLMDSTPKQLWLIRTLGGTPPVYCHAPLLTAPDGRKLSKREGDLNMETLRERYTPEALLGILARLAGLRETDAPVTARDLIPDFSWNRVPKGDLLLPPGL